MNDHQLKFDLVATTLADGTERAHLIAKAFFGNLPYELHTEATTEIQQMLSETPVAFRIEVTATAR